MGRFDYEKNSVNFRHSGKGQKVNRNYKANLCRHANDPSDCSQCTREANSARSHDKRVVHRAKRVKKIKKKKKGGCGKKAAVILIFVMSALGSLGWGTIELIRLVI